MNIRSHGLRRDRRSTDMLLPCCVSHRVDGNSGQQISVAWQIQQSLLAKDPIDMVPDFEGRNTSALLNRTQHRMTRIVPAIGLERVFNG